MGTYFADTTVGITNGTELYSVLSSAFSTAGWATSGTQRYRTVSGRTMTVELSGVVDILNNQYSYITVNGVTGYLMHYPAYTVSGTVLKLVISIADDFFWLSIRGADPGATGAYDATYGSPQMYWCITTIDPASPADTNLDALQVAFASHMGINVNVQSVTAYQKMNVAGTSNATCEFMTDRPAVQDVSSWGDLPPSILSGGGYFGSRYKVIDNTYGIRGQLNNIAFASENYTLGGDSGSQQFPVGSTYIRKGLKYYVTLGAGFYNASGILQSNPLGTSVSNSIQSNINGNASGPRIFIKKGDGS